MKHHVSFIAVTVVILIAIMFLGMVIPSHAHADTIDPGPGSTPGTHLIPSAESNIWELITAWFTSEMALIF